jgi:hypothetical protein
MLQNMHLVNEEFAYSSPRGVFEEAETLCTRTYTATEEEIPQLMNSLSNLPVLEMTTWREGMSRDVVVRVLLRGGPNRPLTLMLDDVLVTEKPKPHGPEKRARRIEINPNLRLGPVLTVVSFEDCDGEPYEGTEVEVFESQSGIHGTGIIESIDVQAMYVYVAVDWSSLILKEDE